MHWAKQAILGWGEIWASAFEDLNRTKIRGRRNSPVFLPTCLLELGHQSSPTLPLGFTAPTSLVLWSWVTDCTGRTSSALLGVQSADSRPQDYSSSAIV